MKIAHVYMYDKMETLSDRFSEKHIDKLPEYRNKYCRRYRREADRQACIISYLLLKQGLYEKFGVTVPIEFIYNKQSKPYLKNTPHIFFNISHCSLGIVCAVADFEIRIDIEEIHPYDPAVARLVCTDGELRKLTESPDPEHLFCRIWTGKEC